VRVRVRVRVELEPQAPSIPGQVQSPTTSRRRH
jgi:hypothetical protein